MSVLTLDEDCPNFEDCRTLYEMKNSHKMARLKFLLFTIFGFLTLVGVNLIVFLIYPNETFRILVIVADIFVSLILLGIPVRDFLKLYFNIKNGNLSVYENKKEE